MRFPAAIALVAPLTVCFGAARAGEIVCARAESMDTLLTAWAQAFERAQPQIHVVLRRDTKLSAEAFDQLLAGKAQVAPFARELFADERARYRANFGAETRLVEVGGGSHSTKGGTHAIAIFVNEKNPLARLTVAQLRAIFAEDGSIATWGQLGLGGKWTARPIHLYGMLRRRTTGNPPGIVNYIEQRVLQGAAWRVDLTECADIPGGVQGLEQIVRHVATDENGIGYSGFGYAQRGTKTVSLGETEGGPFFSGTPAEVARRDYPLSRAIYLCVSHKPNEATRAFLRFVLSGEGQRILAADAAHFLPLSAERAAAELSKCE